MKNRNIKSSRIVKNMSNRSEKIYIYIKYILRGPGALAWKSLEARVLEHSHEERQCLPCRLSLD